MANELKLKSNIGVPPVQQCHNILDWHGPKDPDNPRNFTLRRRVLSTIAVTMLAFVTTLAASIYGPAHDGVSKAFGVSNELAILPLSLYNVGLAFGPLVGSPMSETLGRKAVFLTTSPIFALFILGAGFSRSLTSLCLCRLFAGIFASPAVSNASATIIDYTAGKYRAISLAFYFTIPFFGAMFGPFIGGFVVLGKDWRWTQWTTIFFIIAFYVPVIFTKETYKKTILQRRARKERNTSQKQTVPSFRYFATSLVGRPVHMFCTEPIVTLVCLYNGFLFGMMYAFVIASPWVYEHYYSFSPRAQAISFLGLTGGTIIAPIPLILIDLHIYQPRLRTFRATHSSTDKFPPENRLYPGLLTSLILPTALFAFAWTVRPSIPPIIPIVLQGLAMLATLLVYVSSNTYMLDSYGPLYGASAAGAAMLCRYTLGAAFPMFVLKMYEALGVGRATSIIAGVTLGLAPIPWAFWTWGEGLRKRSRYEVSS